MLAVVRSARVPQPGAGSGACACASQGRGRARARGAVHTRLARSARHSPVSVMKKRSYGTLFHHAQVGGSPLAGPAHAKPRTRGPLGPTAYDRCVLNFSRRTTGAMK